jgi:hypothetical protein
MQAETLEPLRKFPCLHELLCTSRYDAVLVKNRPDVTQARPS